MENNKQANCYKILDHNGRTVEYVTDSNIKEAGIKAKALPIWKQLMYPSIKRCYDGGVRG
jgi:hypothetical protein